MLRRIRFEPTRSVSSDRSRYRDISPLQSIGWSWRPLSWLTPRPSRCILILTAPAVQADLTSPASAIITPNYNHSSRWARGGESFLLSTLTALGSFRTPASRRFIYGSRRWWRSVVLVMHDTPLRGRDGRRDRCGAFGVELARLPAPTPSIGVGTAPSLVHQLIGCSRRPTSTCYCTTVRVSYHGLHSYPVIPRHTTYVCIPRFEVELQDATQISRPPWPTYTLELAQ